MWLFYLYKTFQRIALEIEITGTCESSLFLESTIGLWGIRDKICGEKVILFCSLQ